MQWRKTLFVIYANSQHAILSFLQILRSEAFAKHGSFATESLDEDGQTRCDGHCGAAHAHAVLVGAIGHWLAVEVKRLRHPVRIKKSLARAGGIKCTFENTPLHFSQPYDRCPHASNG